VEWKVPKSERGGGISAHLTIIFCAVGKKISNYSSTFRHVSVCGYAWIVCCMVSLNAAVVSACLGVCRLYVR
jgi:hypothetical protein